MLVLRVVFLLLLVSAGTQPLCAGDARADGFGSGSLLISAERIRVVRGKVKAVDGVISAAYSQLVADADGWLGQAPDPVVGELKIPGFYTDAAGQRKIVGKMKRDAKAAKCLALAFAISKDPKYGLKAKEFVFAWVKNLGRPRDGGDLLDKIMMSGKGDTQLAITYTFPNFIYAFDILDGLGLVTEDEAKSFRAWLRVYVDYCTPEYTFKNNNTNWQSLFLMCAGHALRDRDVFEKGVKYYKDGFRTQVAKDGALPLELVREEKAATYTLMALEAMVQGAQVAIAHGDAGILSLRSRDGGDLKSAVDCLASFLDAPDNWQVKRRKSYVGFKKKLNGPESASDWGWIFELPYSWWHDERYLKYMGKRPYGNGIRTYTLEYSTLLFGE